jgi:hypothetical protein
MQPGAPVASAAVHMALRMKGMHQEALAWLERGVDARDPNMPYLGVTPNYRVLHAEPRFQALLRRIGLPPSHP